MYVCKPTVSTVCLFGSYVKIVLLKNFLASQMNFRVDWYTTG